MRRKYLARLGRAPANCNHKGLEPSSMTGRSSPAEAHIPNDDHDLTDRPRYHGWGCCSPYLRRVAIARRHQARQMWLLARELCASAALHGVGGRETAAGRTLRLAFRVLRDRAGISQAERGRD